MVLAEMAENAVAEMGRLWREAAANKLLPPIDADRRLAMEMAPRIIFVGGGWSEGKDIMPCKASKSQKCNCKNDGPRMKNKSDGQTKT